MYISPRCGVIVGIIACVLVAIVIIYSLLEKSTTNTQDEIMSSTEISESTGSGFGENFDDEDFD